MQKSEFRKTAIWFGICLLVFLLSIFLHEIGHGLAYMVSGYSVSTGFNRVGNVHTFPNDSNFRPIIASSFLLDFGVPVTWLLAIAFTIALPTKKEINKYAVQVIAAFAFCNAILRLVPSALTIIMPIFTGSTHIEDELGAGQLLAERYEMGWLIAIPLILTLAISLTCYIVTTKKSRKIQPLMLKWKTLSLWLAYFAAFGIANLLDNFFRINWIA